MLDYILKDEKEQLRTSINVRFRAAPDWGLQRITDGYSQGDSLLRIDMNRIRE